MKCSAKEKESIFRLFKPIQDRSPGKIIFMSLSLLLFTLFSYFVPLLGQAFVQLWTILVAWSLYLFISKTKSLYENKLLSHISHVYLTSGVFNLFMLGNLGTFSIIPGLNGELHFYIASGLLESLGLMVVFIFNGKKKSFGSIQHLYLLLPLLFIPMVLKGLFNDPAGLGSGLSLISKICCLIIVIAFILDFKMILEQGTEDNRMTSSQIALSFLMSILSIGFYCLYDLKNPIFLNLSHVAKILSSYYLYRGIFLEGIIRPLERLKSTEESFKKEQFYYAQTLSAVKDGMFRYYPDSDTLSVSPVWEEMTGYSWPDHTISDEFLHDILTEEGFSRVKKALELSSNRAWPVNEEVQILHKNGTHFWASIRGKMGKDQEDKDCIVGMMTDISWRKKIEQELILAKEKAEESDRLKTTFLANISHEIRTPLNVLLGFTGLIVRDLSDQGSNKEQRMHLQLIRQSSNQLISIISDIIDISKIQNESIHLQVQSISLDSFFKNLYTVYRKLMDDRGKVEIRLSWKIPDPPMNEIFINTDIERFHQIWQNLLNNAMKFIEYGQISYGIFSVDPELKLITFFVEDTGPGISSDKENIIFERFRQGEEGFARRYGGSGLGLTISRELIHLMGGHIRLDQNYTSGARFLFTLPESIE
ncbi:PAS domain S-box protein [Oceanispirochaeta crateris]|uniref:histidine kinase n=1 Tax=Oceanispirochaeta crateris TaxID=2518645 RepID=A0A5C1QGQ8_9SPIO|nr:ATP-binding protein [Oceanispirochaeta crateris]QEN07285.1 PAS domain S-box protein [Oceanispirochaeta crateris]